MAHDETGPDTIHREVSNAEKRLRRESEGAASKATTPGVGGAPGSRRKRPFPFKVRDGRLWRQIEEEGEDGPRRKWVPFASELHVLASTRDEHGEDWGRLLEIIDRDGNTHHWAMPTAMLAGTGEALRAALLSRGLELIPGRKSRDWLHEYLVLAEPEQRARSVSRIGWHDRCFVLPDQTVAAANDGGRKEQVILQLAERPDHAFAVADTLDDWRAHIGHPARGNARLVLAISAAFAAPLLALTGDEGGGFHFRGASSCGKSSALMVAGSVWGGGRSARLHPQLAGDRQCPRRRGRDGVRYLAVSR